MPTCIAFGWFTASQGCKFCTLIAADKDHKNWDIEFKNQENIYQVQKTIMDYLGSLGWEAYHIDDGPGNYYFKKPIEET